MAFRSSHLLQTAMVTVLALGTWLGVANPAQALLTGGPDIIPAPPSVVNSSAAGGASNNHQQGFNEKQGVLLAAALTTDGGSVPAGIVVNSQMIFLNVPDTAPGTSDFGETWTFDGAILGVISDTPGVLLAASDFLGAPGTTYPGAFASRGLESNNGTGIGGEGYKVSGNSITVGMSVAQPGDWIRVVTAAVPTDEDQCKDGGWQHYIDPRTGQTFRNQGQCVSFLEPVGH